MFINFTIRVTLITTISGDNYHLKSLNSLYVTTLL